MKKYYLILLFLTIPFVVMGQLLFKEEANLLGIGEACGSTYLGNGVSFFDYNNDGWDDLTLCTENGQPLRFFKNTNGTFSEEFFTIPDTNYQTKQLNWVDFDNDGDYDIFLTSDTDGNKLLLNNGAFTFFDITVAAGLPTTNQLTYGASWGDINNDGLLDLFISNRDATFAITNKLYKNNGDSTFTDITVSAGVDISTLSFCAAFFDYNKDGYQDIYVSNDKTYTPNLLYRNDGNETFTEVGAATNTNLLFDAMSVTVDDYNNDGWLDIYVTNSPYGNALLENNGDGTFSDATISTGTGFYSVGWGAVFLDADNDLDLDLYVSGSVDFVSESLLSAAFYQNNGDDTFSIPENAGFDDDYGASYSNAIGDINNDGLPEIVVTNDHGEEIFLWNNATTNTNNWFKVKLEGTASNRDGIGSFIEITMNGQKFYRYTICGEGYLGQNSATEHFGLGNNTMVDELKVTWLSGIVDTFTNIPANQVFSVTEGSSTLNLPSYASNSISIFPNPVDEKLNFSGAPAAIDIEIYNLNGQLIQQWNQHAIESPLDVGGLAQGIYFLSLKSAETSERLKLVKK